MKLIIAIIKPFKLDEVKEALGAADGAGAWAKAAEAARQLRRPRLRQRRRRA